MVDLASYRDLKEQFETLQKEVAAFSEVLGSSKYAIALTRSDVIVQEDLAELVNGFLTLLGLSANQKSEFDFDTSLPYFIQDTADETLGYDREKPYFVAPISSATSKNIEALKYALFNLVHTDRKQK
jgi:GTP-binding protein